MGKNVSCPLSCFLCIRQTIFLMKVLGTCRAVLFVDLKDNAAFLFSANSQQLVQVSRITVYFGIDLAIYEKIVEIRTVWLSNLSKREWATLRSRKSPVIEEEKVPLLRYSSGEPFVGLDWLDKIPLGSWSHSSVSCSVLDLFGGKFIVSFKSNSVVHLLPLSEQKQSHVR